jgi:hypothetical protein
MVSTDTNVCVLSCRANSGGDRQAVRPTIWPVLSVGQPVQEIKFYPSPARDLLSRPDDPSDTAFALQAGQRAKSTLVRYPFIKTESILHLLLPLWELFEIPC